MPSLVSEFTALFGSHGGERLPGNIGQSRKVATVCRQLMESPRQALFKYFQEWDSRPSGKPLEIEIGLLNRGQWEGAWSLAQLHYDRLLKQEGIDGNRYHKGHPLCGLAILGQALQCHSLVRYYASLSSAGDIYWETHDPKLAFGGLGPTILERYESISEHDLWRESVRIELSHSPKPQYLEAFVAARWFGAGYANRILNLCKIPKGAVHPFTEVLLDSVEKPDHSSFATTGTRFEAAAGLLFSVTPGFEVRAARHTTDEQIDLVVHYKADGLSQLPIAAGPGLVECKSSKGRVTVAQLRDFGAKCLFHRVRFGILVARSGITGGEPNFKDPTHAELVRRRFLVDGLTILVLDISQLRGKSRELRGLQGVLAADYDRLVFGRIAGSE